MKLTDDQKPALMQQVFDYTEDGVLILDREFTIVLANEALERRFGRGTPLAGQKCHTALFGQRGSCPACPYLRSLDKASTQTQVVKVSEALGQPEWFELSTSPLRDDTGEAIGAVEFFRDITKRKLIEEQLREETSWRRMLVDQSRDGILILDLDGGVHEANQQFAFSLGYTLDEVRQLHIWDIDAQWSDRERFMEALQRAGVSGDLFETSHKRKDGTQLPVEVSTSGFVYGGKRLVFCVCRDIAEKKAMREQVRALSIRDPLTGLYDRRYILERLSEMAAEYSRGGAHFCISILDIDHFNSVNEIHTHHGGDLALEKLARAVTSAVRPYDLLGRYGGDEVVIASRNATAQKTGVMIERIMGTVRNKDFAFQGHKVRFTFSCGLAHSSEFPREALSIEDMVARAEERLHQAKIEGRDRCVGVPSD